MNGVFMSDIPMFDDLPHLCTGNSFCRICTEQEAVRGMNKALDAKEEWRRKADLWIKLLPSGSKFTSEDLTKDVGLPAGETGMNRNNAVGAYLRKLSKAGVVVKSGIEQSKKVSSHGAALILWAKK